MRHFAQASLTSRKITNIQGGYGSAIRGVMHATEVIRLYEAKEAEFAHNIILINVNKSAGTRDLLDAVRYAWKILIPRAQKAQFVFAVQQGIIRGVYVADEWLPATEAKFPGFPRVEPSKVGFRGREAPQDHRRCRRSDASPRGQFAKRAKGDAHVR
jgi:uncharacterized protein